MGRDTVEEAQVEFTPRPVEKLITHEHSYLWAQAEDIFVLNYLNVLAFKRTNLK